MKKLILLTTILLLNLNIGKAQDNDHLQPLPPIIGTNREYIEYHIKLQEVLLQNVEGRIEAIFFTLPSFSDQSTLIIEYDTDTDKFYLNYRLPDNDISIGDSDNWQNIKLKEYYKAGINKDSAELIMSLYKNAVSKVKHSENHGGYDGTTYYFSVRDHGLQSGKTWSPEDGTKMKKLVDISNHLIELTKSTQTVISFDKELETEIKKLTAEILQ